VGTPGRRYLINGATADIRTFVRLLGAAARRTIDPIVLPSRIGAALYPVAAATAMLGGDAPACPEMLRTLLHGHRFDATRSIEELGVRYTPLETTLERTVRWLSDNGYVTLPQG
jgi:nucleoside-diphosphate-sugar epimerase